MDESLQNPLFKKFKIVLDIAVSIITVLSFISTILFTITAQTKIVIFSASAFAILLSYFFIRHFLRKNKGRYRYEKELEEYHIKYSIDKETKKVSSVSKHSYIIKGVGKELSATHHQFNLVAYPSLPRIHVNSHNIITSLVSDYDQTRLEIIAFSGNNVQLRVKFDPPIPINKSVSYSFKKETINSIFITSEELDNAIKKGIQKPFCFTAIMVDAPTKLVRLTVEFPDWYKVKNVKPYVLINGELEQSYNDKIRVKVGKNADTISYTIEVSNSLITIGYHYCISWLPVL